MKNNTKEFIKHFPGHHIFVSMPEDSSHAPIHYHSGYAKAIDQLQTMNSDKKYGVFFTVNELDEELDVGRHRTKKMVTRCRAVFMDDDVQRFDGQRDDFPLSPSLVVHSSPGKYHYYWLIDGGTDDKDQWNLIQRALMVRYNGDKQAKDITRYLRLPGYNHNKKEPFMVTWLGEGTKYGWGEICEAFPQMESGEEQKGSVAESEEVQTEVEMEHIISTAGPGLHGAINKFLLGLKRDGMNKARALRMVQALGKDVSSKDERTINRFSDAELSRSWDLVPKLESDDIALPDEAPESSKYKPGEFPWPPGFLGELSQIAYDNQLYQHKEIAVISAIGLVAGVVGRKFNFHRSGLNVYLTLIMRTGGGKDSIGDFINNILNQFAPMGKQSSFIGSQRFTGPPSIAREMENALSQVCVFTEAGLLLRSKAGDKDGLSRTLLSLYSKSAKGKWSGRESYSHIDNSIKPLPSPALTIINEATPETLLDALSNSGALEKGELPRQSIYRVDRDKPTPNYDFQGMSYELTGELRERMQDLIASCADIQADSNPDVHEMILDDNIRTAAFDIMEHYRNIENEYQATDLRRSIMASRAAVKVMKFAAIANTINYAKDLTIREPEWLWAKAMVEYEMKGMDFFFEGSGGDEMYDLARSYLGHQIYKVIMGKCNKSVTQSDAKQRKAGVFPFNGLKAITRSSAKLNAIGDDTQQRSRPIDGLMKLINYMVEAGLLVDVSTPSRKLYKVTADFRSMMYNELD